MQFEKSYFDKHYKEIFTRNPYKKLSFLLEKIKHYKNGGKLLDIGFGYGAFLSFAKNSFQVYGIDYSAYTVERLQKDIKTVKQGSAEKIPFQSNFFDVVSCLDVLEHVPSLEKAFSECRRVLKKDGVFLLLLPVYGGMSGPFIKLLDNDKTHIHKYSREFWLKKIEIEGFTLLEWGGIFRYLFFQKYYFHYPTIFLRDHAPAIFILAKKK